MVSESCATFANMPFALRSVRGRRPRSDSPRASSSVARGSSALATSFIAACTALRAADTPALACTTSPSCFSRRVSSLRASESCSSGSLTPIADVAARCAGTKAAGVGLGCARRPSIDATPDVPALGVWLNISPLKTCVSAWMCAWEWANCFRLPLGACVCTLSGS